MGCVVLKSINPGLGGNKRPLQCACHAMPMRLKYAIIPLWTDEQPPTCRLSFPGFGDREAHIKRLTPFAAAEWIEMPIFNS